MTSWLARRAWLVLVVTVAVAAISLVVGGSQSRSYSSNALPDRETLVALLREVKDDVEVRAIPHTYHYGTHHRALRRQVDEYLFIGR